MICPECGEESVPYDCRCAELEYDASMAAARRRDRLMGWAVNALIVAIVLALFLYGVRQ